MKTKSRNVSLTLELDAQIERRVNSGRYGNASDVMRAALRALEREEQSRAYREWLDIAAKLPSDPITPEIEQQIVSRIRAQRTPHRKPKR